MNKPEIIEALRERGGMLKKDAEAAYQNFVDIILDGLRTDGRVVMVGLGIFSVVETAARTARNPKTGEPVAVPAGTKIRFRPAKGQGAFSA